MKTSRNKAQKGFTLIEVSLAIVIGVIILAGAITLYNQSKLSAGNSKAQEKSLALASLAEEMAANNNGQYASLAQLNNAWLTRRDDARSSPWGGALNAADGGVAQAQNGTANGAAAWAPGYTWPSLTGANPGYTTAPTQAAWTVAASAGELVYMIGNGTSSVYDVNALVPHVYANYIVGVANNNGAIFSFTNGGK